MPEWKDTVNLPRTGFPMKANLQTAEPEATAQIHLGDARINARRDIVIKSRRAAGFDAPYTPGYVCHGLPIELNVGRELGSTERNMSLVDIRRACREYARGYIDVMTAE